VVEPAASTAPDPERSARVGRALSKVPDTVPKDAPGDDEGAVAVEMFLVLGLREHQTLVSRYIRGYLVLEELQDRCREARDFSESGPQGAGALSQLRRIAWDEVHAAHVKVPEGLDDLTVQLDTEIDAVRDAFYGDENPYKSPAPDPEAYARFAGVLSQHLWIATDAAAEAAGVCRNKGLDALEQLARYVDSIFNRTEEARRTASLGRGIGAAPTTPSDASIAALAGATPDRADKAQWQSGPSSSARAR
jgi:hypothetical protein